MGAHNTAQPRKAPAAPSPLRRFDHAKKIREIVLAPDHPAMTGKRTLFPGTVRFVEETGRVLKSGHNSRKIGKTVMKGAWARMPIYTLTLQERATCPDSCAMLDVCYGNHMHLAERLHHDADFEEILWIELDALNSKHPDGYVVRLHVLGDFYSLDYVKLWERALDAFPALRVFGYTARDPDTDEIGAKIYGMTVDRWSRFAVRFSGKDWGLRGAVTVARGAPAPEGALLCPAQTGDTECCATCGLCWTVRATIAFQRH